MVMIFLITDALMFFYLFVYFILTRLFWICVSFCFYWGCRGEDSESDSGDDAQRVTEYIYSGKFEALLLLFTEKLYLDQCLLVVTAYSNNSVDER